MLTQNIKHDYSLAIPRNCILNYLSRFLNPKFLSRQECIDRLLLCLWECVASPLARVWSTFRYLGILFADFFLISKSTIVYNGRVHMKYSLPQIFTSSEAYNPILHGYIRRTLISNSFKHIRKFVYLLSLSPFKNRYLNMVLYSNLSVYTLAVLV